MTHQDPGWEERVSGAWLYGTPEQAPGHADPGNGSQLQDELHQAPAVHGDPGGRGRLPLQYTPAPSWRGEAIFVPGTGDQPLWDVSSRQASCAVPPPQRRSRFPVRVVAGAALILTVAATITVAVVPRASLWPAGSPVAASQPPAITRAQAARVVSAYWQVGSQATAQRSIHLLGRIEGGTSFMMDAATYTPGRASVPPVKASAASGPVHVMYDIPRLAAGDYPRWFVATVTYGGPATPQHPAGPAYLLFTQASPGSTWKNVLKPQTLPGSGPAPQIAAGSGGFAIAVNPAASAAKLSIAPAQIRPVTASTLDGSSAGPLKAPGNFADLQAKAFWQSQLPAGSADTDAHRPGPWPVFGLRTTDGGALLFYPLTAQLTLAPPPGTTFELTIPGDRTPSQALAFTQSTYIEQFATYDPPQGHTGAHIAADASGITSGDQPAPNTPATHPATRHGAHHARSTGKSRHRARH